MTPKQAAEPLYPLLSLSRLRMDTDGPGITTLAAGAGCSLRCRWCINARLLREAPAEEITASQLLDRVKQDDLYFRATGGGVTFGGGEPLLHAAFIRRFRELCPPEWRICLETSLAVSREQTELAAAAADTFLVDCKDLNGHIYRGYTGGDVSRMRDNLRLLLDLAGPERVTVRVPRIPDYNTREDQLNTLRELAAMGVTNTDVFEYIVRPEMRAPVP